jgi:hypothetical protein
MGKPFLTICKELLVCTGHSPGSVLDSRGNKEYVTVLQNLKESNLYCWTQTQMMGVVTGGETLRRMFSHSHI